MPFATITRKHVCNMLNRLCILLIGFYQTTHGLFFWGSCRFYPTCSCYGKQAFQTFYFWRAFYLTSFRILRCHPFCKGGFDYLPEVSAQQSSSSQ